MSNKAHIEKMAINLNNLVSVLGDAFNLVNKCKFGNIVLAIGATGCGKSTMLTSLVFGAESLEKRSIEY